MTQKELVKATAVAVNDAYKAEGKKTISEGIVDDVFKAGIKIAGDKLASGDKIQLNGFGSFEVTKRAAREGHNPATGEKIDRVDTSFSNKTYRQRRRQAGYRIQIYSGDNSRQARQKAYQLGYLFKSYFPDIPVYTHFYSPHWVCRAGDFRTIGEARSVLGKMRYIKGLSGAAIIRSTIQVEIYE